MGYDGSEKWTKAQKAGVTNEDMLTMFQGIIPDELVARPEDPVQPSDPANGTQKGSE